MPLRAISGDENIFSFKFNETSWENLKVFYKSKQLVMPCCKNPAIPKTSKLGNYFFAHGTRGDCNYLPESPEHIYIKTLVANAAIEAGWEVTTEHSGETPQGEKWIADVFCRKRKVQLALEIQCSSQTEKDTRLRQARYDKSNIRCCWFLSEKTFTNFNMQPNRQLPYFLFSSYKADIEPKIKSFDMNLKEFVIALLSGKIKWKEEEVTEIYNILCIKDRCWNKDCKKEIKQIYGYSIDVYGDIAKTVPNASTILEYIHSFISNEELKKLGLNSIKACSNLKGNAPQFPYCNICLYCGLPQSNFYLMQKLISNKHIDDESCHVEYEFKTKVSGNWKFV